MRALLAACAVASALGALAAEAVSPLRDLPPPHPSSRVAFAPGVLHGPPDAGTPRTAAWGQAPGATGSRPVSRGPARWSVEDAAYVAVTAIEEAPPEGRAAVAWVVRRRMRACGCRAAEVVRAPMQFQPWRQPGKVRRMLARVAAPDAETALEASRAAQVLAGRVPDPTGGADHFHAAWVEPGWAGSMVWTGDHGGNRFYRRAPASSGVPASR